MADVQPLSFEDLSVLDRWWRAANYLSVGQIYLLDNPLLREPLLPEHVKPRLLGHWGTTPGLTFVYAHMNRAIPATNVTDDDPTVTAKIALAHLNEFPDYYTRLERMEEEAKHDWADRTGNGPSRRPAT